MVAPFRARFAQAGRVHPGRIIGRRTSLLATWLPRPCRPTTTRGITCTTSRAESKGPVPTRSASDADDSGRIPARRSWCMLSSARMAPGCTSAGHTPPHFVIASRCASNGPTQSPARRRADRLAPELEPILHRRHPHRGAVRPGRTWDSPTHVDLLCGPVPRSLALPPLQARDSNDNRRVLRRLLAAKDRSSGSPAGTDVPTEARALATALRTPRLPHQLVAVVLAILGLRRQTIT